VVRDHRKARKAGSAEIVTESIGVGLGNLSGQVYREGVSIEPIASEQVFPIVYDSSVMFRKFLQRAEKRLS
jgi:hypothetical protein